MTTLCYIEKDDSYLMMHRTVKKNDVNKDKWIGVGGHAELGESPEECLLREVKDSFSSHSKRYKAHSRSQHQGMPRHTQRPAFQEQ